MTSTLGKRKERDEEVKHGSTFFVSNLPYTATSVDLQTLFSDIAPVRSAFIVTEHGTGVSKGVGYVSFSIKEDAQSAYDKLSQEGISLAGRQLRIQWAENKPKEKGEKVKKESKPATIPRPQHPKLPQDPLAIRTVVVSGLPASVDSKILWKKFRKYPGAEKVEWPVGSEEEERKDTAHVLFDTPSNAQNASNKLHAHVFKGSLLSAALKKRLDNLQKPGGGGASSGSSKSRKSTGSKDKASNAPSHASRLIVRNIPFNTTEQDLRAIFLPYGPIYSIHIPLEKPKDVEMDAEVKQEDGTMDVDEGAGSSSKSPKIPTKSRTRGFAFVWMMSRKDAEKALEECNGTMIRGGMAESMVEDKQKRKKQRRLEKKLKAKQQTGADDEKGEEDGEDQEEGDEELNGDERIIAVDWALSKDKWEEEKAKMEAAKDEEEEEESESDSDATSSGEDDDDEALGLHEDEDSDSQPDSEEDEDEDDEDAHSDVPVKPQLPTPDSGTTLFIRNIPFTASEDELRTLFRAFGPLRYARITMDPETGRSRGTGFACFWNKEDADKVIEQSDLLRQETTGSTEGAKKNPFSMPSILTPDPSSTLARSLVLQGRTLDVVRAVTRDEAGKLKEEGEKRRQKEDKRNMYLLREGVILPNTPAASTISPADLERRTASFSARKNLLKSNPSLYISKTRLSVRQIPIFVTEHMLKRLALHAVKAFNIEFKHGERTGLTADELTEGTEGDNERKEDEGNGDEDDGENHSEEESTRNKKGKGKGKKPKRLTGVKQAKIVRQQERVDPLTGKGRSKGYGFVEMHKHADALRVLRWANNNPKVGGLFEEWWKDELKVLLKAEKTKPQKEEARIKRIQDEIDNGGEKKSKGTLIVEFSIENVQVVQRRNTQQKERVQMQSKPKPEAKQQKLSLPKIKSEESPSPKKKRRTELKSEGSEGKPGQSIGFLIGRKRKERKTGKGK
ncbi:RNA-binding domain-containing protein [Dendrothele bispora CBS 962.96]|uniref:RNA-binding domain-containing protein n=1 Tax=Dendrothele bispora (strain CBS 962.96) TaxID=1314807 RepID=A0A4S8LWP4_DENBC|nr:RNA-binding domain-containing protein [Dendrothele bispora CBS 962.96]